MTKQATSWAREEVARSAIFLVALCLSATAAIQSYVRRCGLMRRKRQQGAPVMENRLATDESNLVDAQSPEMLGRGQLLCPEESLDSNGKFVDEGFPADSKSLAAARPGPSDRHPFWASLSGIVWRRAQDFMEGFSLLGNVSPDDVVQGHLDDCYFLSVLSVLAERPHMIRSLFLVQEANPHGAYAIKLCRQGIWTTVTLDDYFPCWVHDGPVFSKSKSNSLWPMLLEKGWAKMLGSYSSVRSGLPSEALFQMTGAPIEFIPADRPSLMRFIDGMNSRGESNSQCRWFACAIVFAKSEEQKRRVEQVGLLQDHAYSILDARELLGEYVLRIRNPWGQLEWNGDWSDESSLWHSVPRGVKEAFGHFHGDDGNFWVNVEDFTRFFSGIEVCKVMEGWHQTATLTELTHGNFRSLRLSLREQASLAVGVHQGHSDSSVGIRVMIIRGSDLALASYHPLAIAKHLFTPFVTLPCGEHWVALSADVDARVRVGVSVYSSEQASISPPTWADSVEGDELIHKVMALRAKSEVGCTIPYSHYFSGAERVVKHLLRERDLFVWHYENTSARLNLFERLAFQLQNARVIGARGSHYSVRVRPGQVETVIVAQNAARSDLHWSLECETEVRPSLHLGDALRDLLPPAALRQIFFQV